MPDLNDILMKTGKVPDLFAASKVISEPDVRVYSVKEIIALAAEHALKRKTKALTSGHFGLDLATGGFEPGFVWVMGAETNFGKSSWLVAVADTNIKRGKRVLIVSGEDSETIYGRRMLLRRARVSAMNLKHKHLTADELDRINETAKKAEPMPVIVCTNGKPIEKLLPHLQSIIKNEGIDLIALDYLQAIQTERRGKVAQDRRHEVAYVARTVTDLAKNNNIAGLLLSQLTIDKQREAAPNKYDLRESQDLANAAEVVVLGYRPLKDDPPYEAKERHLIIAKNKDGEASGFVRLKWDQKSACFDDVVDPETERFDRLHDELGPSEWDR